MLLHHSSHGKQIPANKLKGTNGSTCMLHLHMHSENCQHSNDQWLTGTIYDERNAGKARQTILERRIQHDVHGSEGIAVYE